MERKKLMNRMKNPALNVDWEAIVKKRTSSLEEEEEEVKKKSGQEKSLWSRIEGCTRIQVVHPAEKKRGGR